MSLMSKPSKLGESDDEEEVEENDVQNSNTLSFHAMKHQTTTHQHRNNTNTSIIPASQETPSLQLQTAMTSQLQTSISSNTIVNHHQQKHNKQHSQDNNKLEMYKHIKPLSVDDLSGGRGKISYPSLDEVLNSNDWLSGNNLWMSYVLPSAPPVEIHDDEEKITYPLSDLHDQISNNTLQYILPPITNHEEETTEQNEPHQPPKLPPIVIHKIQPDDTLTSIAIKYGVNEEAIKLKNRILSSDLSIYNKTELEIPDPTQLPKENLTFEEMSEEERQKLEERKKAFALTLFMKLCCVSEDEARYYLSVHDFNFKEAVNELRSDLEWEKEYQEKLEKKKRKKRVNKVLNQYPILLTISNFLSTCFPIQKRPVKNNVNYQDVELDMLPDDNLINYDSD
ncbi:hypothetical protein C9374_001710 [Naegleria lovaniensis]|uniref:LysM domain-containing protein n=1 Tax=Naegleria lovaniensis TaxID=51637 RepID=A0AA88GW22_NAELO|nr:uncharacterized protein C9374_001710 [Naegleria lovaniensis]KAG2387378.1 hypothetical protein C9374_001710 [Naegleria lovaniensis]